MYAKMNEILQKVQYAHIAQKNRENVEEKRNENFSTQKDEIEKECECASF